MTELPVSPADSGTVDADNPWPGLAEFREADQDFFFGREEETEELLRLVQRERLTVLFGLSGLGKTSLLQAGLFPGLRREDVLPATSRLDFSAGHRNLVDQVREAIRSAAQAARVEAPVFPSTETLWESLHRKEAEFWGPRTRLTTPLLVFDQFEEVFTLGRRSAEQSRETDEFLTELASLAEGAPPPAFRARAEADPGSTREYSLTRHAYKILFSLREDFLADLDSLRGQFRSVFNNRMRLRRMNGESALRVVKQAGQHIVTPEVGKRIVRFVAGQEDRNGDCPLAELEVEPALLSFMCRELNNKRRDSPISAALLEGSREEIVSKFFRVSGHLVGAPLRLPPLPRCFGRSAEIETLVTALCAEPPRPVPVLGPGGVGKTTVTVAALHDRRVVERFGARRWFVRCDSATSRDALASVIASALGLKPGGQLEERAFRELERGPGALILDNAETPWEGDIEKTEELLAQIGNLPGLALIASFRGDERPLGPSWTEAIRLGCLSLPDARETFLSVAGERFREDPVLDRLLEAVDGLPLAITLLAWQAESGPDLSTLWLRWQRERDGVLTRSDGGGRLLSVEASLEISVLGPRMTDEARRLLTLLGVLPDGIAHEDLDLLLPQAGDSAAATLRRVGLAFSQSSRLHVLTPVREHAARRHPPSSEDLERARHHYLSLAARGDDLGQEGGFEAAGRLGPETGNLEAMVLRTLAGPDALAAVRAVLGIAELFRWAGLGSPICVEQALSRAREAGNAKLEGECLRWLGDIARARSRHDPARVRYEEALPLYRRVGDLLGEANCIKSLGDIALDRSDYDSAGARCEEALLLYRRLGDTSDEANCIKSLGDIAVRRLDHDAARIRYEEALLLFRHVGAILGEANCIRSLGDIALDRSDYDSARARYEEALPLYRRVGSVLGEANCIKSLGNVALDRSDHNTSRARFEQALPLYRHVGDLLGEANCIQSLGDIDQALDELAGAKSRFGEALELYSRFSEPYSIGWAHVRLARIEDSPEEHWRHVAAARDAWTQIKRSDLIEELEREFGEFPTTAPECR